MKLGRKQTAFNKMKFGLTTALVLSYLNPNDTYMLDTDANDVGVGTVLSRIQEETERVITYYSKTLAAPENYFVTRK